MSRSGYSEDCNGRDLIMWRGQVASATRGKRGQAFLAELLAALEAMPEKRLIENDLRKSGEVCTLGAIGAKRGVDLEALDPEDYDSIAEKFGIAHQLVQEIEYENDEGGPYLPEETPEARWIRMRDWVKSQLKVVVAAQREEKKNV